MATFSTIYVFTTLYRTTHFFLHIFQQVMSPVCAVRINLSISSQSISQPPTATSSRRTWRCFLFGKLSGRLSASDQNAQLLQLPEPNGMTMPNALRLQSTCVPRSVQNGVQNLRIPIELWEKFANIYERKDSPHVSIFSRSPLH